MSTKADLQNIAQLAYLPINEENSATLLKDLNAIIDFVDQLHAVDTHTILPLRHPLDLHQRLRLDEATEENIVYFLSKLAPEFSDGLYLVPKVLESEK